MQINAGVPVMLLTSSLSGLVGTTYIGVDDQAAGHNAATGGRQVRQAARRAFPWPALLFCYESQLSP